MKTNKSQLLEDLGIQIAMWADDNLFGHDIVDQEDYAYACQELAADIEDVVYDALAERPVR